MAFAYYCGDYFEIVEKAQVGLTTADNSLLTFYCFITLTLARIMLVDLRVVGFPLRLPLLAFLETEIYNTSAL
jgi:hypothetical protein